MKVDNKGNMCDRIIWLLSALLYASFTVFNTTSLSSIGVMAILILLVIACFVRDNGRFTLYIESMQAHMLIFAAFCAFSALWSRSADDAITNCTTVLKVLLFVVVLYACYARADSIKPLLTATVLGGYIIAVYFIFIYGGLGTVVSNSATGIRDTVDFANVNAIGINMATVITVNVAMILDAKKIRWHDIGIILPIVVLAACQSRTAIIAAAIGIFGTVLFSGALQKKFLSSLFAACVVALLIVIIIPQIGIFNGVMGRLNEMAGEEVDASAAYRLELFNLGMDLFKKNPILGIGMGNAHLYTVDAFGDNYYLHNNYAEMLASGGILGFLIYYSFHFELFVNLSKKQLRKHKYTAICIVVLILWLVRDIGGVTYYFKETYWYFLICFLQIRIVKNKQVTEIVD